MYAATQTDRQTDIDTADRQTNTYTHRHRHTDTHTPMTRDGHVQRVEHVCCGRRYLRGTATLPAYATRLRLSYAPKSTFKDKKPRYQVYAMLDLISPCTYDSSTPSPVLTQDNLVPVGQGPRAGAVSTDGARSILPKVLRTS
eukprot:3099077-Rhodomonas_salina.1